MAKYENTKNSRNSSIPPSKDYNRPKTNQSLRSPSGKIEGGLAGREGKALEMTPTPDKIVILQLDYCASCGAILQNNKATIEQCRQVVDILPTKAICALYETFSKVCNCGCQNRADFPQGVTHTP